MSSKIVFHTNTIIKLITKFNNFYSFTILKNCEHRLVT